MEHIFMKSKAIFWSNILARNENIDFFLVIYLEYLR